MPAQTLKVDRSTRWGTPFEVGEEAIHPATRRLVKVATREQAIELFALYLRSPGNRRRRPPAPSFAVLGIPALMSSPYLPYLLGGLLLVALLPLAVRAARGGGAVPRSIALVASAVVLLSRFGLGSDATTYAGAKALIIAPYRDAIVQKARGKTAVGCGCAADASTTAQPNRGAAVNPVN
jgi:hypothetical protein